MSAQPSIEKLIRDWAKNTQQDNRDLILQHHAEKLVVYDVLPPMRYTSAKEYRASWDQWQPTVESESKFELHDLVIEAGRDHAFAYGLIECGGKMPDGHVFKDWVRATFCLRLLDENWTIVHQHVSKPMKSGGKESR